MALSTSNSKNNWLLSWIVFVLVAGTSLFYYEAELRARGFLPSVDMHEDLWSWHRMTIDCCGTKQSLVLLGASRLLVDISMDELASRFPGVRVRMLALNGKYPLAALEHLANDERFDGRVLVAINAQALEPWYWDMQRDYVNYYEDNFSLYLSLDAWLKSVYQSQFSFADSSVSLRKLLAFFNQHKRFKSPLHTTRSQDLSIRADFDLVNVELSRRHFYDDKLENYRSNPPTPPEKWLLQADRLNELVKRIEDRGGQVVLLRLPTSDGHWELDETFYPRAHYWDRLAERSRAPAVHFLDIDGLKDFELPDTSHLDYRDRREFTSVLFNALPFTTMTAHQ
jgi:hypothetical protein